MRFSFFFILIVTLLAGCSLETSALIPGTPSDDAGATTDARADGPRPSDTGTRRDTGITRPTDAATDSGPVTATDSATTPPTDSATAPDTTVPPPPTWVVIETLTVDSANAALTYSTTVLEAGVVYRLRASGVVTNVIGRSQGDADWWDFSDPKDNGCCEDIGLGIDDFVVDDLDTQPNWGPYEPSHVYQVEWTGDGTTIAALYQDTYYGNNIGDLTLEILALR